MRLTQILTEVTTVNKKFSLSNGAKVELEYIRYADDRANSVDLLHKGVGVAHWDGPSNKPMPIAKEYRKKALDILAKHTAKIPPIDFGMNPQEQKYKDFFNAFHGVCDKVMRAHEILTKHIANGRTGKLDAMEELVDLDLEDYV